LKLLSLGQITKEELQPGDENVREKNMLDQKKN
jgi:hypothetical protein